MVSENKHNTGKKVKTVPVIIGMAVVVFISWCCSPSLLPPVESDVPAAHKRWKSSSFEELKNGYTLYINKCGSCHYLYRPDKFSEEKWIHEIKVMGLKAKLDTTQTSQITRYILTARDTKSFSGKN